MQYKMIVEQLGSQEYRREFDSESNSFIKTPHKCLLYCRNFVGIYGWILGYGSPPNEHLDVLVPTDDYYELGSIVGIKIIGCFRRGDNDNKYIGIEETRKENTLSELPVAEMEMLKNVYPVLHKDEAWLDASFSIQLLSQSNKIGQG